MDKWKGKGDRGWVDASESLSLPLALPWWGEWRRGVLVHARGCTVLPGPRPAWPKRQLEREAFWNELLWSVPVRCLAVHGWLGWGVVGG